MLNNLIKLLSDTGRLKLGDIKYNKSIPIEDNPELNELEIKLRKELAYIHAMELRNGNVYLFKSQFEPKISSRFAKRIVFPAFPIIKESHDLNGVPFRCKSTRDYDPYFFKYKSPVKRSLSDQLYIRPFNGEYKYGAFHSEFRKDPDNIDGLYIGED